MKDYNQLLTRLLARRAEITPDDIRISPETYGIARASMPQIDDTERFLSFLESRGVSYYRMHTYPEQIKLTQKDFDLEKVCDMLNTGEVEKFYGMELIVSEDRYVLDGHHRLLALHNHTNGHKLARFVKVELPMTKLLNLAYEYDGAYTKQVTEENTMKTFVEYLLEEKAMGGEAPGKLEIAKMTEKQAVAYLKKHLSEDDFERLMVNFSKNFAQAQDGARKGFAKRKDMPVIASAQVKEFQRRLSQGFIDLKKPFAEGTSTSNPFPQGLTGEKAKEFLENGIEAKDGDKKDDIVKVKMVQQAAGTLKPIQQQIYFDKSFEVVGKQGLDKSAKFYQSEKTILIASSDNYIIDGHHRYMAATIIDPKMKLHVLKIDLPIKTLLNLSLAYGDAIGNKRNG